MDAIRLDQRAVDDVKPLIIALCSALGKVPSLSAEFEGTVKMTQWLQKMNKMRAVDEISDDESRQLLMELVRLMLLLLSIGTVSPQLIFGK